MDQGSLMIRGRVRQTKPISGWRREAGGRSGSSYGLQLPVFRLEDVKQTQCRRWMVGTAHPAAPQASRCAKQSQFGPATPGRQTKPIFRCSIISAFGTSSYDNLAAREDGRNDGGLSGRARSSRRAVGRVDLMGEAGGGAGWLRVVGDPPSDVVTTRTARGASRPSEAWACVR